ncbi:hypothetical protein [Chondromyces crocatus]|uniref:Uncharacterized protein n=1 Tax=Chondromyces crocatus TaxID=52 RepID=A0A0K1EDE0_CHOCO|nr:hypothetical protein [Chondromyces crocatus]AKT38573.1 uncharacterized protein CMC5_027200 [Chondromyces crocatus]
MFRRTFPPLVFLSSVVAGCSGAPATTVHAPARKVTEAPSAPVETAMPARWVVSGGATLVGPSVEGGTLVLLGGRRGVVSADGALRTSKEVDPEPLEEVLEVPAVEPSGKPRVVLRGAHGIYRLDEPLGPLVPLAHAESVVQRLGSAPGRVMVFLVGPARPQSIDVETGKPNPLANLPLPPLSALRFLDAKVGAALFEVSGLAVTSDGGATWRLPSGGERRAALRMRGLRVRGGELRAYIDEHGSAEKAIDAATGRLSAIEAQPAAAASEPALLRWVRRTGRDPLEAAVVSGVAAATGTAVVASHGLAARVDLVTGNVLELASISQVEEPETCGVGGTARAAWVACAMDDKSTRDVYEPFGVVRIPLGEERLVVEPPTLVLDGAQPLRTSPSGGVMLVGPCKDGAEGNVCVRQPNGKWLTLIASGDPYGSGAGALLGGRVAQLGGLWRGDEMPPLQSDKALDGKGGDEEEGASDTWVGPFMTATGPDGHVVRVGSLGWGSEITGGGEEVDELQLLSPIEEGEDHALSFVLKNGGSIWSVVQPSGEGPYVLTALTDTKHASIRQGHGLALGENGEVQGSLDGGRSWVHIAAPAAVRSAIGQMDFHHAADSEETLSVGTVGMKIDTHLRLGWGPAGGGIALAAAARSGSGVPDATPASEAPATPAGAGTLLSRPVRERAAPERILGCASRGPAQGLAVLGSPLQLSELLSRRTKRPPTAADERQSTATQGRWGVLDAMGLLEARRPSAPANAALTWTLHWLDPSEVGSKLRSWTGKAPPGVTQNATLSAVAASGDRALFSIRAGHDNLLVRVKSAGGIEVAKVPWNLLPTGDVVFGTEKGETIAWEREAQVLAWRSGEPPRVLAPAALFTGRTTLGQPTARGVPLLLYSVEQPILRMLSLDVPGANAPDALSNPTVAALPLDGWTPSLDLHERLGTLPACGARPQGVHFRIGRSRGEGLVDGSRRDIRTALYDVWVHEREACVSHVVALLDPQPGSPPPQLATSSAPPAGPIRFVRMDLVGKRADGGDRGAASTLQRLTCTLEPRP